jgi:hypothetical protein
MNAMNMPGFTAGISLYKHTTSYRMTAGGNGYELSGVVPQLPKWVKCGAAILAETAACLGGPNPACIGAAAAALDICT